MRKFDVKSFEIGNMAIPSLGDQCLGRYSALRRTNFYRRAMRIVGTHIYGIVPHRAHRARKYVRLYRFDHVPQMDCTIGIGQTTRYQEPSLRHALSFPNRLR